MPRKAGQAKPRRRHKKKLADKRPQRPQDVPRDTKPSYDHLDDAGAQSALLDEVCTWKPKAGPRSIDIW